MASILNVTLIGFHNYQCLNYWGHNYWGQTPTQETHYP